VPAQDKSPKRQRAEAEAEAEPATAAQARTQLVTCLQHLQRQVSLLSKPDRQQSIVLRYLEDAELRLPYLTVGTPKPTAHPQ